MTLRRAVLSLESSVKIKLGERENKQIKRKTKDLADSWKMQQVPAVALS
jgi:hypothetical protein